MSRRSPDDGIRARITYGKTFTRNALKIALARDRPVKHGISNQNIFFCPKTRVFGWINYKLATAQSFAGVIICIPLKF